MLLSIQPVRIHPRTLPFIGLKHTAAIRPSLFATAINAFRRTSSTLKPNSSIRKQCLKKPQRTQIAAYSVTPWRWSQRNHDHYSSSYKNYENNMNILKAVIAVNTVVFLAILFFRDVKRSPDILMKIAENTLLHDSNLRAKRYWTLVTSSFTHHQPFHFIGNMFTLYAFGSILSQHYLVRPVHLVVIILGSALSCSYAALMRERARGSQRFTIGASGVAMGLGGAALVANPYAKLLIYGILPAPLAVLVPGYALFDSAFLKNDQSLISHAGHLGGLTFGLIYGLILLRRGNLFALRKRLFK